MRERKQVLRDHRDRQRYRQADRVTQIARLPGTIRQQAAPQRAQGRKFEARRARRHAVDRETAVRCGGSRAQRRPQLTGERARVRDVRRVLRRRTFEPEHRILERATFGIMCGRFAAGGNRGRNVVEQRSGCAADRAHGAGRRTQSDVGEEVLLGGERRERSAHAFGLIGERLIHRELRAIAERLRIGQRRSHRSKRLRVGQPEIVGAQPRGVLGERAVRRAERRAFGAKTAERPNEHQQQHLQYAAGEDHQRLKCGVRRIVRRVGKHDERHARVDRDDHRRPAERGGDTEEERPHREQRDVHGRECTGRRTGKRRDRKPGGRRQHRADARPVHALA